ncbi:fumarylacetoacetate hydrolase family protein [Desmospora profundinema]|uniref:2-keto-4-pentenoate hydratase/2-oxohepta-3-ene-1,7-dioic acid hydratase in catechol pathway n=1 Tax=Desmospora profundinema TaxID=1571184 RepID=A0ABU1IJZ1_9BACL|nr:fumarylacetoacetate hydrolase family protein [Desmospora profundinema]MDR6224857.1 2-keto-4-pentenoate hydratase/2-oxohepta-3-ene-1,7-dioic acid hydratase in catechol pathway [Desmospora profundinema]
MKWVRVQTGEGIRWGYHLQDGRIQTVVGEPWGGFADQGAPVSASQVGLSVPVFPRKLIAIGRNYAKHAAERGNEVPAEPLFFLVSPTALIGDGEAIRLPNREDRIDHEAELAVVIGTGGKDISEENAWDHIFGYACAMDITNRVQQEKDGQFTRSKSYDTFKPIGPWIETDWQPSDRIIRLWVNQELKQEGSTSEMVHSIPRLIATVSAVFPLESGDVILTGTPDGVGPLAPGDNVEMEIEGLGRLSHPVVG